METLFFIPTPFRHEKASGKSGEVEATLETILQLLPTATDVIIEVWKLLWRKILLASVLETLNKVYTKLSLVYNSLNPIITIYNP